MSLRELSASLAEGLITPSRAVEIALDRINETEADLKAWVRLDAEGARAAANQLEQSARPRGPLWGIPVGIKDLIDVAGLPTRCGSSLRDDQPARRDADCVRLLRDAGAVIVGKTVTTEFGYFKPGPTRNPANLSHTPGGSSSGSAAAVAAGAVPLALGTQTAGSLTRPASFCGAAGFVAPTGTFSLEGVTGLSHSLDTLGFLAPSVADLHFLWEALKNPVPATPAKDADQPARVLLWNGSGLGQISTDMTAAVEDAGARVAADGGSVGEWSEHDLIRRLSEAHMDVMAFEAAQERAAELNHAEELSAPLVELLTTGLHLTQDEYRAALQTIADGRQRIMTVMQFCDAILGPAALGAAPAGIGATGSPVLSRPWQALGFPVVTIPGLRDGAGMPLGIQLIGLPGCEDRLFSIAKRIETVLSSPRIPIVPNR
ncbi:amidase [Arthrobacter sp. ISL-28]|uniref:amidase n=1 Tax=Arthrobacter sp. ISL-28 TaxID=2819108 RepID=UPI001BEC5C8B|nr:amidase [Arthrobacter sp. ISL-28]MBT2522562.1 amidase [Arthrobacter sp. ISL-28]